MNYFCMNYFSIDDELRVKLDTLHEIEQDLRKSLELRAVPETNAYIREIRYTIEEIKELIDQCYEDEKVSEDLTATGYELMYQERSTTKDISRIKGAIQYVEDLVFDNYLRNVAIGHHELLRFTTNTNPVKALNRSTLVTNKKVTENIALN